ncbi:substrate-binding domain-containing protein [Pasteurella canis]|uniref:helical backbone metal receptor n=1 Tax=Pasteurella canis TaxID=753 RepID=UPI001CBB9DE4|nr:helical backbone metal receptor [Pasteurella canis]UAX41403.1 helical backbone metal receptor [Pasteurella canis]
MFKILKIVTALLLTISTAQAAQFVSLNLCADRLLIELARTEQIAAMSNYSANSLMMLDKVNVDKPQIEAKLIDLLPYLDKTLLINEQFYPQLVEKLRSLGVKVENIVDPQTPEQLFALILRLGRLTDNQRKAEQLVKQLKLQHFQLKLPFTQTLMLSDTGIVESQFQPYSTLLDLLGLLPLETGLTQQNFSLEKLLLSQPNVLIRLTDKQGYNEQAELVNHPILQKIFRNRPIATIPLKYSYCFDHGLWQGAEQIYQQLNKINDKK